MVLQVSHAVDRSGGRSGHQDPADGRGPYHHRIDTEPADVETAALLHELAVEVLTRIGPVVMDRFASTDLDVQTKSSAADVVTDADLASEALALEVIHSARPEDGFLGEEGTSIDGTSGVRWVIDPIDSTANFARGIPIWSVSLAAMLGDEVVAAAVGFPPASEIVSGTRAEGLLLNGRPVTRPEGTTLAGAMVGVGWGPLSGGVRQAEVARALIPAVGKVRSPGSPALGLSWAALGRFDAAFYEMQFSEWDVAAGAFLCQCAGLEVRRELPDADRSPRLLAAPPGLMAQLAPLVGLA